MEVQEIFNKKLSEYLDLKGLSASAFAKLINDKQQKIWTYQNGTLPKIDFLHKLLLFDNNISLNYLVAGHGDMFLVHYGEILEESRQDSQLTRQEFADKAGLSRLEVERIEGDPMKPSDEIVKLYKKYCSDVLDTYEVKEPPLKYDTNIIKMKDEIIESLKRELKAKEKIINLLENK